MNWTDWYDWVMKFLAACIIVCVCGAALILGLIVQHLWF